MNNTIRIGLVIGMAIFETWMFARHGKEQYEKGYQKGKIDAAKEIKEKVLYEYNELAVQRMKKERERAL